MIPDKTVRKFLKKNKRIDVARFLVKNHKYDLSDAIKQIDRIRGVSK